MTYEQSATMLELGTNEGNTSSPATQIEDNSLLDSKDPDHPRNWSTVAKVSFCTIVCAAVFGVSFASSILGPAASIVAHQYQVSEIIMQLGVSLFVAGFAAGPLVWGPFAEAFGNRTTLIIGVILCGVWQIPLGVANNVPTILVARFLAGSFGSSITTVSSGILTDLYDPIPRGTTLAFAAVSINLGSSFAPIVASYLTIEHSWRWLAWIPLIYFGCLTLIVLLFLRESDPSRILAARQIRGRQDGSSDEEEHSTTNPRSPVRQSHELLVKYLKKPVLLFAQEPILIILTIYMAFVYGLLYLSYQLFPIAFRTRGWSAPAATLPFISVAIGLFSSVAVIAIYMNTWYKRKWLERGQISTPEDCLPPMILGSVVLPPAIFWFGWTLDSHPISQLLAAGFIGLGLQLVFTMGVVYIVNVYRAHVVSAFAIHITVRSLVASTFPIWTQSMYLGLGFRNMTNVLGAFAALMLPFPLLFFFYGPRIRSWSRYSEGS
uniref:Major facilitator superfamily (MFS) profile domain-containing protein n=1 Tax=Bionectria ochroleuca TaxID=29856 RepID=A0A8H7K730_BIOOC